MADGLSCEGLKVCTVAQKWSFLAIFGPKMGVFAAWTAQEWIVTPRQLVRDGLGLLRVFFRRHGAGEVNFESVVHAFLGCTGAP